MMKKALFEMKNDEKALSDEELKKLCWRKKRQNAQTQGLPLNPNAEHNGKTPQRTIYG